VGFFIGTVDRPHPLFTQRGIEKVSWSTGGRYLLVTQPDGQQAALDARSGSPVMTFEPQMLVNWSPGDRYVTVRPQNTYRPAEMTLHDAQTGALLLSLPQGTLVWSSDERHFLLLTGGWVVLYGLDGA
jgi:hypothetical protein